MKKILSLLLTLTLAFVVFGFGNQGVNAEVPADDCTTDKVVVVHYKRWDDDYTNMDFWSWGSGTLGTENPQIVGTDDFGAVGYICVDEDAGHEAGLIPRLNDWSYKDGTDVDGDGGDNKYIPLREASDDDENTTEAFVGFDENGMKHVYVLQGSASVYTVDEAMPYFQKDGFGTLVVVYYDPVESYDGWNMWTWDNGTDGSTDAVDFQYELGVDQTAEVAKYRVGVINVASDAADTAGFIVRTDAWEKQWEENILIDTSDIKGSGTKFVFYIGGTGDIYNTYADFDAQVNLFEIAELAALDPYSIELEFNKDITTSVDGVVTFDGSEFTLKDKDGTVVEIQQVSFDTASEANSLFTIITTNPLTGAMGPYEVTYAPNETDSYMKTFDVDSEGPEISFTGFQDDTIELGETYDLPIYEAVDYDEDDNPTPVSNIKVKDGMGTVDTSKAGVYEVVIVATDNFGNSTEATVTVTVIDPCDDDAHLEASNTTNLVALLVGAPLAVGAFVTLRKNY